MDKELENKYESLKKSMNNAIKLLCNKREDIKVEVRELKKEKVKNEKTTCKQCICSKTNENMKNRVDIIEEKVKEIIEHSSATSMDSDCVKNKANVEKIEYEIQEVKKRQAVNCENILLITKNIEILQQSHDALKVEEVNNRDLLTKMISEKAEVKQTEPTSDDLKYECSKCDTKYTTTECLLKHKTYKYPSQFTCKICNHKFEDSVSLEQHMMALHSTEKQFKCNLCESAFVVEWRFRKHFKNHQKSYVRKCHYYNNKKECPYSHLGCKFLHVKSSLCEYNGNCKIVKCQYQHSSKPNNY